MMAADRCRTNPQGMGMNRKNWEREQLLKVLSLYCQIPFGRMHSRNTAVIAVADAIGRTPASVALKLVNFASLDPELQARGVRGMGNTSAVDRAIWSEFYGRWEILAENSVHIGEGSTADSSDAELNALELPEFGLTEVIGKSIQRRGQSFFRASVIAAYDGKCCITGISCRQLLRASHIVPWSHDQSLRLDPHNGLCLNALHDAAFDRGLITLSENLEVRVSSRLKVEIPEPIYTELFVNHTMTSITMPERFRPASEMLEYHRSKIFVA